ncbi:hypothetical protein C8T65DRAFT_667746 [Cerioporus squamosus]|nr:hypothetical protein C8T65DRAFT_667746 [Cerioporus squamosus]
MEDNLLNGFGCRAGIASPPIARIPKRATGRGDGPCFRASDRIVSEAHCCPVLHDSTW